MGYKYINVIIDDLCLSSLDKNIMIVPVSFYEQMLKGNKIIKEKFIKSYIVDLDIQKMGIDWNGEFEFELAKDFQRALDVHGSIPTRNELKELVELNYYGMVNA